MPHGSTTLMHNIHTNKIHTKPEVLKVAHNLLSMAVITCTCSLIQNSYNCRYPTVVKIPSKNSLIQKVMWISHQNRNVCC